MTPRPNQLLNCYSAYHNVMECFQVIHNLGNGITSHGSIVRFEKLHRTDRTIIPDRSVDAPNDATVSGHVIYKKLGGQCIIA